MPSIASRIKEGLQIRDMKQSDLAKITGIGKSSISTYLTGAYEPKQKNLHLIAKALNVSEAWLMGLDVPMESISINSEYSPYEYDGPYTTVPLFYRLDSNVSFESVKDIESYATESVVIGSEQLDDIFNIGIVHIALRIPDNSMMPRCLKNDVAIIELWDCPKTDVTDQDWVAVAIGNSDVTIRQFERKNGACHLVALNPQFPIVSFDENNMENIPVNIIGKITEIRIRHFESIEKFEVDGTSLPIDLQPLHQLNSEGQKKVMEYASDLIASGKYRLDGISEEELNDIIERACNERARSAG